MRRAIQEDIGLTAVRYPRGNDNNMKFPKTHLNTDYQFIDNDSDMLLISYGRVYQSLWEAHCACEKIGYRTDLLKLTRIFPVVEELVEKALQYRVVMFFEESSGYGGISTIFGSLLAQYGFSGRYVRISADCFLKHASVQALLEKSELSAHAVCRYIYAYGHKD